MPYFWGAFKRAGAGDCPCIFTMAILNGNIDPKPFEVELSKAMKALYSYKVLHDAGLTNENGIFSNGSTAGLMLQHLDDAVKSIDKIRDKITSKREGYDPSHDLSEQTPT